MQRRFTLDQFNQRRFQLPQAPSIPQAAFCACPPCLMRGPAWAWQQQVYQRAFAEAQAVVRPSILERDLLGVWN
jgi:hypothetical protein